MTEQEVHEKLKRGGFSDSDVAIIARFYKPLLATTRDEAKREGAMPVVNDAWCVACGHSTLFLGTTCLITCAFVDCPDPGAMHDAVARLNQEGER